MNDTPLPVTKTRHPRVGDRVITPEGYPGTVVTIGADDGRLVRLEVWYEPEQLRAGRVGG